MNFYPFHLGDYAAHTKHLNLLEDLAYRRMIDLYYTSEKPLPLDPEKVARLIGMRDHMQEVSDVLSDFFVKSEYGYINSRCDKEIETYRAKADRAKSANKARWGADKSDTHLKSDMKSDADRIPTNNQEPITKNQEPKGQTEPPQAAPATPKYSAIADLVANGVDEQVAADWLKVRKGKKLAPNKTGIDGVLREISKAGMTPDQGIRLCCERGWAGFNPSWLANAPARASPGYQSPAEKSKSITDALTGRKPNEQRFVDIN